MQVGGLDNAPAARGTSFPQYSHIVPGRSPIGNRRLRETSFAAASSEQSSGIQQVNAAVIHMEQVVQQNASLVEEASAATESMRVQADALLKMVARFNLGDLGTGYVAMQADTRRRQPQVLEMARPSRMGRWIRRRMALTGAEASVF